VHPQMQPSCAALTSRSRLFKLHNDSMPLPRTAAPRPQRCRAHAAAATAARQAAAASRRSSVACGAAAGGADTNALGGFLNMLGQMMQQSQGSKQAPSGSALSVSDLTYQPPGEPRCFHEAFTRSLCWQSEWEH